MVKEHLHKLFEKKRFSYKSIALFVISLVLFVQLGLIESSIKGLLIIVGVILIHELGHFAGMRYFGYQNVSILFFPLLGAGTMGKETYPDGTKRGIVSLLGPIPGILIGLWLWFIQTNVQHQLIYEMALTFLIINTFNLLPFHPLDGGRLFEVTIFARNTFLEIAFKVITSIALILVALVLKSFLLAFFALLVLLGLRRDYLISSLTKKAKKAIPDEDRAMNEESILKHLPTMQPLIVDSLPEEALEPKTVAQFIHEVWNKACLKPVKISGAFALLLIWMLSFGVGVVSSFQIIRQHAQQQTQSNTTPEDNQTKPIEN